MENLSIKDVSHWMVTYKISQNVIDEFKLNEIDGLTLQLMPDLELDNMVSGIANRIKLKALVQKLKDKVIIFVKFYLMHMYIHKL